MSGRRRILFRVARAMISDDAIVSGLVLALLGEAHAWRKSGEWSWPLCCLALQFGIMAVVAIAGECWRVLDVKSKGKELHRWRIWNSRNREDRDPGRLA